MNINATTACFPGYKVFDAVQYAYTDIVEPILGRLSTLHMQLCPQNPGLLDEAMCDNLMAAFPYTRFRLHANAHVLEKRVLWDAANYCEDTKHYYQRLAEISKRLKAPAYSLHAGVNSKVPLKNVIENMHYIQEIFGDIPVAIEGLYPGSRPNVMSTWDDYRTVYESGLFVALDISHLNILKAPVRNWHPCRYLINEWIASPQTLEVHLSANDGHSDQHNVYAPAKLHEWARINLNDIHDKAIVFSEGNYIRYAMK